MEQPDGSLQCRECPVTLDITVEKLTQLGIRVFESAEHFIGVCEACSCPSGRLFRVLVHEDRVPMLRDLGWKDVRSDPERQE